MQAYEHLKRSFERFKKPDGEKSFPAKTCRDLFLAHPDKPSGDYWIDPNEGDVRDAILVYCNADTKATCVKPSPEKTPEVSYVGHDQEVWLSEVEGGIKMTYKADSNQLGFLQLLSVEAQQNFTYHCLNSVAYFDSAKRTYRKGLKLLGWNDVEITPRGNQRVRYEVTDDDCRFKRPEWAQTVLSYSTDKPVRLPIMDIAIRDIGQPDQKFWIEVGNVCFI